MNQPTLTLFIVDDDQSFRQAIAFLLKGFGYVTRTFESAERFLASDFRTTPGILILDVKMPGLTGLELQNRLIDEAPNLPIIFISGHGDIDMAVSTMVKGATLFLQKPVDAAKLLEAINRAKAQWCAAMETRPQPTSTDIWVTLSQRERQIAKLSVQGLTSRQIAERLGIAQRTVEFHKASAMRKFQVHSNAELAQVMASVVDVP